MSASELATALRVIGVPCAVEARERLAVVRAPIASLARVADASVRRAIVAAAAAHGFTHVALEIQEQNGDGADITAVSGD